MDDQLSPELDLPSPCPERTEALVRFAKECLDPSRDRFEAFTALAPRLGGTYLGEGVATFGFYAPHLADIGVSTGDVFVELLVPREPIALNVAEDTFEVRRVLVPLVAVGQTFWGAAKGCVAGNREQVGLFYAMRFRDWSSEWGVYLDPLARSLPFGAFGPAELYDMDSIQANRDDRAWFEAAAEAAVVEDDGVPRLGPPTNIMEVHVGTATPGGTIRSLDMRLRQIAERIRSGGELTPQDKVWLGYDAIQLMPVHAIVRDAGSPPCWQEVEEVGPGSLPETFEVHVQRPAMTNWGYDVVISGAGAPNPAMLATRRPHEVVDLSVTMHTFPERPIRLMFDLVFGHADNQAVDLLPRQFFLGPNMYGQDMNFRNPAVRAILLEMQRRIVDLGADGVRIDGAQDFKWWNAATQELLHDDEFLDEMSAIVQCVGGVRFKPWMIFEDGRPWPREDWELASTYRAVTDRQPHVWQWGPLTFAHNTPFLYTFWIAKWWRVTEILSHGEQWISGVANHDTVRRGTQVSPKLNINQRLGSTLLEIIDHAYDHAASNLLFYGCLPGTPMDFLNASMRASWGFMRNTDDKYAVQVAAQEASFLDWQVDDVSYNKVGRFRRLKALGFEHLEWLRNVMHVMAAAVTTTEDLEAIAAVVREVAMRLPNRPSGFDKDDLWEIARAFMDDVHDYCNVSHYGVELDPVRVEFNLALRRFRAARPWLQKNLRDVDFFDHRRPAHSTVLFYGLRRSPDDDEEVLFVSNMQGAELELVPTDLPIPGLAKDGWALAVASPRLEVQTAKDPVVLRDAEGLVFVRRRTRAAE